MELKTISPNVREIAFNSGRRFLFSYGSPVAMFTPGRGPGAGFARTDRYFSHATSRHIVAWLDGEACTVINHDVLLKIASEVC